MRTAVQILQDQGRSGSAGPGLELLRARGTTPCGRKREEKARETANLTLRKDTFGNVRKYPSRGEVRAWYATEAASKALNWSS